MWLNWQIHLMVFRRNCSRTAVVGVDCPAIFPFSPNAWILGFLFTTLGELIAIACGLIIFHSPVLIIAGFVPLFFDGGPVGVYANKHGGFKAVVFFCTLTGYGSGLRICRWLSQCPVWSVVGWVTLTGQQSGPRLLWYYCVSLAICSACLYRLMVSDLQECLHS